MGYWVKEIVKVNDLLVGNMRSNTLLEKYLEKYVEGIYILEKRLKLQQMN